jgi:hypothetical protein
VIHHQTLPLEQDVKPGTAKPPSLLRQFPQTLAQGRIVFLVRPVTVNRTAHVD